MRKMLELGEEVERLLGRKSTKFLKFCKSNLEKMEGEIPRGSFNRMC